MRAIYYHRVGPALGPADASAATTIAPERLAEHAAELARHWRVVSLAELAADLLAGTRPPPGTVHVSFDDGFRSTLVAADVFDAHRLPWTVFAVADAVLDGQVPWYVRLAGALACSTSTVWVDGVSYDLAHRTGAARFKERAKRAVMEAPASEHLRVLEGLLDRPGIVEPDEPIWPFLTSAELRELAGRGVEVGNHSATHANLTRCRPGELVRETAGSQTRLQAALGQPVPFFAYPDGCCDRAVVEAAGATHELAMATWTARRPLMPLRVRRFSVGSSVESLREVLGPRYPVTYRSRQARWAVRRVARRAVREAVRARPGLGALSPREAGVRGITAGARGITAGALGITAGALDITVVTGAFPVRSQGFIERKVVGLAARGHQVHVVARAPGDHDLAPTAGPGLRVTYLPGRHQSVRANAAALVWPLRRPAFAGRLALSVARTHGLGRAGLSRWAEGLAVAGAATGAGRPPGVVHFEWSARAAGRADVIGRLRMPTVVSCRGSDVLVMAAADPGLAAGLGRLFSTVDAAHCVSDAVRQAAEGLGLDPSRAFVVRPAVDTDFFRPAGQARPLAPLFAIVSVGRAHPVKGYRYGLEALRALVDRGHDARYTIIGGGEPGEADRLRSAVEDLGLADRVRLLGWQAPEVVRDELARSDAFLLPSMSEGLSNAALEAMAMELAVVVTDVGGMAEAVRDGVDGFVVAPGEAGVMADRLEALIGDPGLRARMGRAGRERVVARFGLDAQLDQLEARYRELIAAGARAGSGSGRRRL